MEKLYRAAIDAPLEVKALGDGKFAIEGWASTPAVDSYNDIVLPIAFADYLGTYLKDHPLLLINHGWYDLPIGKVVSAQVRSGGLWIRAEISDTETGRDVITLIQDGVLKAFSIGFEIVEETIDRSKTPVVRTITKLKLYEISVVNIPANMTALFAEAKAKGLESITDLETKAVGTVRKMTMSIEPNKDVGETKSIEALTADIQKSKDEIGKLHAQHKDEISKMVKGHTTPNDLKEFGDRLEKDLTEKWLAQQKAEMEKLMLERNAGDDFHEKAAKLWLVYDRDGQPLEGLKAKAAHIFGAPVDYNKVPRGEELKQLRKLADRFQIVGTAMRAMEASKGRIMDVRTLKCYKQLQTAIEAYDPILAKAMYSTGTALGDEWVPLLMSPTLTDFYRLPNRAASFFPTIEMPSQPFDFPIRASNPTFSILSEPNVNNPAKITATDQGTGKITFDAKTYGAAVKASQDFIEDSVIAVADSIAVALQNGMGDMMDNQLINGDNTATHFDTQRSLTSSSSDPLVGFKGIRRLADEKSATFSVVSTTAGVGDATAAYVVEDVLYINVKQGVTSVAPSENVYFSGVKGAFRTYAIQAIRDFSQSQNQFAKDGQMNSLFGSPFYISGAYPENLAAATGKYTGGSDTTTSLAKVNTTQCRLAHRRGATLEFKYDPETRQWTWVLSARYDFKSIAISSINPVGLGFAIP